MLPKLQAKRSMEERTSIPQWQSLLLLPPGDSGTCGCMHQSTVTWVSCLTSNLQNPLGVFPGRSEGILTAVLLVFLVPQLPLSLVLVHRLPVQLSALLCHCSPAPSCAPHQSREECFSQLCSGAKKPMLGHLCHPTTPAIKQPQRGSQGGLLGPPPTSSSFVLPKAFCKTTFKLLLPVWRSQIL